MIYWNVSKAVAVFADSTKITVQGTQEDIYRLQEWSDMWNFYFNVTKLSVKFREKD